MDKEHIIGVLREHEPELRAAGLLHLRLFGSVARGEGALQSDVDLLFDCEEKESGNILGIYGFEDRVTEILGVKVHLSSAKYMRLEIKDRVLGEAVSVF